MPSTQPLSKFETSLATQILGVAIAYAVSGWLGLLLAAPPGYASAIFPAAGLAVGAVLTLGNRVLPGVWLGSFTLNALVSTQYGAVINVNDLLVSTFIGVGATLQTWVAAFLVNSFIGRGSPLVDEKRIIFFLLLIGPIASATSATIGVTTLVVSQNIVPAEWFFSWWTWWVGDAIGAMLMTPIVLTLLNGDVLVWRRRRFTVSVPLLIALAVVILVFVQSRHSEQSRIETVVRDIGEAKAAAIKDRFLTYQASLSSLEQFYAASENVERGEFKIFIAKILREYPGIQAMEWLPMVRDADRTAYEASIQKEGFENFQIVEHNDAGEIIRAPVRDVYFPVTFVEPFVGNEKAFGFNVGSHPFRRAALEKARDTGIVTATRRIDLVQDHTRQAGLLLFWPVYKTNGLLKTVEARRQSLRGFAVVALRMDDLLRATIGDDHKTPANYLLYDVTDRAPGELLAGNAALTSSSVKSFAFDMSLAQRQLRLVMVPTVETMTTLRSWQAWVILVSGLVMACLLGAFLLAMTGHTENIHALVDERTQELSAILESALDAIITIDAKGIIQTANPAAERLFGYRLDELKGANLNMLMPSPIREKHASYIERYLKTGESQIIGRKVEFDAIKKDGTRVPLEIGVSQLTLRDKILFNGVIHDLTERKRMEKLQKQFIATVSHELRTPLTAVRGSIGLILGDTVGPITAETRELLVVASNNLERLTRLINDILDMEKLESGNLRLRSQISEITNLLQLAIENNRAYAEQFKVSIEFVNKLSKEALVNVDVDRFQQIMANLLSNAAKFSHSESVVTLAVEEISGRVVISVRDRGTGIPDEFKADIFSKFARADNSATRSRGGTGLGLSIVKSLVEHMGGSIRYDTKFGEGTTFTIELPKVAENGRSRATKS